MHQPAATYRTHVSDLIGASELKSYYRTDWRRTVFTFFHIWLALGLSLGALPLTSTLPLFARIPLWAFLVVFIGSRLNAIAVQVHEASHFLLFEHKRLNHWFCNLLGAYWILNDVESYWHVHKNHHLHLHETNDPDRDLYLIPDRPIRILAVVACDFFWVTAFRRVLAYLRNRPATGRAENADVDAVARGGHFAGKVAAQSFVLLLFFWMFAWPYAAAYYFVFWLVPLFSIFPLFIRLRIVTEHFADALHESDDRKPFISRTTVSNVLEDYFIGSQMQYHMEHHLYQNIPHYMLVRLHRELVRRGFFERNRENQYNLLSWGYLRFWRQMISDMRRRRSAAPAAPEIISNEACCILCGSRARDVLATGEDFEYDSCANTFQFMRCCNCGHCYLNPVPDPSELPTIYPPNYGNYSNSVDAGVSFRLKGWLEGKFLLAPMDSRLPENAAVLDIGCGDGRLLDGVRNHCPRAADLEGVEISEVAAEAAGKKGYVVHLGSFDEIQFPGNRYDLVFLIQVIEHVFDPVAAVRKIHALLKPGGWVVFETPSVRCVDFALFKRRFWGGYHFPRHINLFEPGSFRKMLASQGFDVASIKHKLQPVHWIWTCHHFFKSRGFPGWWTKSFHIKNVLWLTVFSCVDLLQLLFLRRSSNMQIIAQKRRTATVTEDVANSRADGNRIMPSLETEKDAACSAFVDVC